MFCKYCGSKNADGAKFCVNCGKQIGETVSLEKPIEEAPKRKPGRPKKVDTTIVENKFDELKDEIKVEEPKVEPVNETEIIYPEETINEFKKPKKRKTGLVIFLILLVLALIGAGVYYFVFRDNSSTASGDVTIDLTNSISCNIEVVEGTSSCDIDWSKLKSAYGSSVSYNYEAIEKLASEKGLNYDDVKAYYDQTNPIDDLKQIVTFAGGINDNGSVDYDITCVNEELLNLYNFKVVLGSGSISLN